MSEYADIIIRNLTLYSFRNYLQNDIVHLLFSKLDYVCIPNYINTTNDEDSKSYTKHMYKTTVQKAKERLDALGFTISRFETLFNQSRNEAIDYSPFLFKLNIDYDSYEEIIKKRIDKYVTFKKWINSINKIIKYELKHGRSYPFINDDKEKMGIRTECDKIIYYSLKEDLMESFYGLKVEVIPIAYILRLILESCEPVDEIILDFTYLSAWAEDAIPKGRLAAENDEKTIVLVEGTSDKEILEFAIAKFYPHLSDLFYFMDFEDGYGGKRGGGASLIVTNLKAFYFSKLKSKFIAIFDNDVEGYQSKCSLENDIKNWSDNIKIFLYPQDKLFKSYPTLLPNGTICNDDINKKACSIELYLPDSIIKENEVFYPIEWEARRKIKNGSDEEYLYQGVITHKEEIKKKFISMRNKIEAGNQPFIEEDWKRIKKILDTIVFAFTI
ncbi:HEPN/Toprim-associated domain-containing protein [Ruminococcus flavefaciens]|uniref:HEPN/Toprim-associated domain-containing protein n=1 Tax=Ruminococcus flavefaciens TaxID=1265 RepID=UPI00048B7F2F|nr:HEPN/Toprim-associated domain-containing protein [Ruminococcus flavefaciens]